MTNGKEVTELEVTDLITSPVWEFTANHDEADTIVYPVSDLPVDSLAGRIVGTQVELANGALIWATLSNLNPISVRKNQHFVGLAVYREERQFVLARYFDLDADEHGPEQLAKFLDLPIDQVFPITYDVRAVFNGNPAALAGRIEKKPVERLTMTELMDLPD